MINIEDTLEDAEKDSENSVVEQSNANLKTQDEDEKDEKELEDLEKETEEKGEEKGEKGEKEELEDLEKGEEKGEEKEIDLELGDIIQIFNRSRPDLDKKIFLIKYIDDKHMKLAGDTQIVLAIHENKSIDDGTIDSISLLSRSPLDGYARQNGLLPDTWITIFFMDEDYTIPISGEITNLEEDMIEVTTFPEKNVIYIDFSYKGLPENMNILDIQIGERPIITEPEPEPEIIHEAEPALKTDNDEQDVDEDDRIFMEEEEQSYPEEFRPIRDFDTRARRALFEADRIHFGEYMDEIVEYYNVEEKYKRYSIEDQTSDLLDDLLSSIPESKRTRSVLAAINTTITRFIQLRDEFSIKDEDGNVRMAYKKGSNYIPLVESFSKLKKSLYWIVPVAKNNMVYMIDDQDERIQNLEDIIKSYKSIDVENNYKTYLKRLNSWFAPFEDLDFNDTGDIICNKKVNDNFAVMINNLGEFKTDAFSCHTAVKENGKEVQVCELMEKQHLFINYNETDNLFLKSIITFSEPVARFSRVNLPGTDIMIKSNLSTQFINYAKMFKMQIHDTDVTPHLRGDCLFDEDGKIGTSLYEKTVEYGDKGVIERQNGFLDNIKNYFLNMDIVRRDGCDLFEEYLSKIVPKTRQLFHLMKKYLKGKLSVYQIIHSLEPFLIYHADITFQQYMEMTKFLDDEISNYIKSFIQKSKIFQTLKPRTYFGNNAKTNMVAHIFSKREFYETVVKRIYGYNEQGRTTNSELLKNILLLDSGNVYNYAIRQYSSSLHDASVGQILTNELDNVLSEITTKSLAGEPCKTIRLAKRYRTLEELESDNGKKIFYDREFDKTPYSIVDNYVKEKQFMEPDAFYEMLSGKLVNHGIKESDVPFVIEAIKIGHKEVNNMDYAIIFNKNTAGDERLDYYVRKNNTWELDDIPDQPITDELACLLQETCNYKKQECLSNETVSNEITANSLKNIVEEFDKKYEKSMEENKNYTTQMLKYYTQCITKLKEISNYRVIKYTLQEYKEGLLVAESEVKQSPYVRLRDMILGQTDIVKKYQDILKFTRRFTFEKNEMIEHKSVSPKDIGEEDFSNYLKEKELENHWLYCRETETKLLPRFYYVLAKTFIDTPDEFERRLDLMCFSIGKKSDDGDKYVDKYSGFTLRNIDFVEEYGVREEIEDDFVFEKKAVDALERRIMNIVKSMESTMMIHMELHYPFILATTKQAYHSANVTEKEYAAIVENLPEKKKKTVKSYTDYSNNNLLLLTLGTFFIAIQTSIPEIKFKYSFPGCRKSFSGYPLTNDDETGLEYIACVASKIKSSIEPWNVLKGKKDKDNVEKIKANLKQMIEDNLIGDLSVRDRIDQRIATKDRDILSHGIFIEHSFTKWVHFLPAIIPFKLKEILPVTESVKNSLFQMLRLGDRKQVSSLEAMQSKIIQYSYLFQKLVQDIVSKKALLLFSRNGPFVDNVCCNETNEMVLQYFIKENPKILQVNEEIGALGDILRDVTKLTKSKTLFGDINTKNKTYVANTNTFNGDVIIRALMIHNNYISYDELQNSDQYKLKLNEKLEQGTSFSTEDFLKMLRTIGLKNPVQKQMLLPRDRIIHDELLSKALGGSEEDLKNFLGSNAKRMEEEIISFILEHHKFKNRKDEQDLKSFFEQFGNWKKSDEGMNRNICFMRNSIHGTCVFPYIILNKVNHENNIHSYWNLTRTDDTKLRLCVKKYYDPLEAFYADSETLFNKTLAKIAEKSKMYSEISQISGFDDYTTVLLLRYCLFSILYFYVTETQINFKVTEPEVVDEFGYEMLSNNKLKKIKKQMADVMAVFVTFMKNNKSSQNIVYDDIMDRIFILKEKEKETFTERLEMKEEYEREVDNVMKSLGLGDWGKGNQKSLYQYSKEVNESDEALKDKLALVEERLFQTSDVSEGNIEQYLDDAMEEEMREIFGSDEDNDISDLHGEDYGNNFEEDLFKDYYD